MTKPIKCLAFAAILSVLFISQARAATVSATSCATADVQSAINSASNGDTVTIPDGSCTWTSGVTVNKRVMIRAKNSTPVQYGRDNQSVVLTNNASVPLFTLTTGNDYYTGIQGIRFNEGARTGNHIYASGSGSKIALINDCYIEENEHFGVNYAVASIRWDALGGLWWDTQFYSLRNTGSYGGELVRVSSPRAWASASTMGTQDTNGSINLYIEDCTFTKAANSLDLDTNARAVIRYSRFDGSNAIHHGLTSNPGARHSEWYGNTFSNTFSGCNIGAVYFWIRGGTAVITNNVVNNATYPSDYGSPVLAKMGEHDDSYGSYPPATTPAVYMAGWGHNGTSFVSEPIFIWGNTGARGATYGWEDTYWQGMTALNRDLFVNATTAYPSSGAKPGWVPYTYPHPLRGGDSSQMQPPETPSALLVR